MHDVEEQFIKVRMLTLCEVQEMARRGDRVCWYEEKDAPDRKCGFRSPQMTKWDYICYDRPIYDLELCRFNCREPDTPKQEDYGKTWRCWSYEPCFAIRSKEEWA